MNGKEKKDIVNVGKHKIKRKGRYAGFIHVCSVIGHFGDTNEHLEPNDDIVIENPIITLVDRLRDGSGLSSDEAAALADLIDNKSGLNIYQMRITRLNAGVRKYKTKVQTADTIREIEKILLSSDKVSEAIVMVSEMLGVDERSVWRRWRELSG